jgi:hypothetical protein
MIIVESVWNARQQARNLGTSLKSQEQVCSLLKNSRAA